MTRKVIVLGGDRQRSEAIDWVRQAPIDTRIEFQPPSRTLAQNSLMWLLLSQLAEGLEHCGEHYDAEAWKCAFLKAMGKKIAFMPALDGEGVVAIGYRSSTLSKDEFSELIERIYEYGARHGVEFHGPKGSRAA